VSESKGATPASVSVPVTPLRRTLSLRDLVVYGIVLVMPIAPVPLFGVASKLSRGHMVTTILIAMVAMTLTAISYGRMAALYPAAGSAYTYVGRGLNPHLGFLAGWAMFFDYLIVPLLTSIYGALTIQRFLPHVPYALLAALFVGAMTFLNLQGIRSTARMNMLLLSAMCVVIGAFVVLAVRYLFQLKGWGGLFAIQPFYNAEDFDVRAIMTATSFAALTYIGFDGVTSLAEDVVNPERNVLLATVLVCLLTGVGGGLEVYLAQRVWPDYQTFPNLETAFMDVTWRVGGPLLFEAMAAILIIANFAAGMSAQVAATRVMLGMGRDNMLPGRVFAYLHPKRNTPTYSICIVGVLAYAGTLVVTYERAGEILNFGAFLAFMGVNLATLREFFLIGKRGRKRSFLVDALLPGAGFLFCLAIWLSLPLPAKTIGSAWFLLGLVVLTVKTRGFRTRPIMMDVSGS
jgi:putrescine importer